MSVPVAAKSFIAANRQNAGVMSWIFLLKRWKTCKGNLNRVFVLIV